MFGRVRKKLAISCIIIFIFFIIYIIFPEENEESIQTTINEKLKVQDTVQTEDCWLPVEDDDRKNLELLKLDFKKERNLMNNTKIILLYTGLFFSPHWWGNKEKDIQKYTHNKNCKFKDCYFTYRKNAMEVADLVIFHGVDLNKPHCLRKLSDLRPFRQIWLFFMHESPVYTNNLRKYNGLFNWTMTYMQKSDIFVPYFSYENLRSHSKIPETNKNYAAGKTGKVVWVVSHCGLIRDDYVLELEKHIDVKVFGDCGVKFNNNMGRCNDWGKFCEEEIKNYKFYLSFENCFCEDYITEKYWEKGLKYGLIPVVMGAFDRRSKVISNSYIDVNNFQSIQELANYLLYLDRNDTAYNEYFKWHYHYEVSNRVDALCEVCKAIHDTTRKEKVYGDIDKFWGTERNCDPHQWKINHIKMQISKSKFRFHND